MTMTQKDRDRLQTLVKRRFRALKTEVDERHAELYAQMEAEIAARYAEEDQAWAAARHEVNEAVLACNRTVNDAFRRCLGDDHEEAEYVRLVGAPPRESGAERIQLRRAANARVEQQVKAAKLQLERQEVNLLEKLLIGGLETDEARAFLESIPTVGELVPASRLAELDSGVRWEDATDG
jgi:hypothetical protein